MKINEMTKEFKEFKFRQNLRAAFLKDEKVVNKIIFIDTQLDSNKVKLDNVYAEKLKINTMNFMHKLKAGHMKVQVGIFI